MFRRFSAPRSSPSATPAARTAGRSFFPRSARPLIGKRAFSKPERIFFSGMGWTALATTGAIAIPIFALTGDHLMLVAGAACLVFGIARAFDSRCDLRAYFNGQLEHAVSIQGDLHLDNAALRQELVFANLSLAEYRRYIQFLAAGQVGGAEGDELCGESPSAGNVVPFRRMH
jgi:hypothetical protein